MISRIALVVTALAGIRTSAAEPCAPRAALDGDAAAVASVGAELARLGVTVTQASARTSSRDLGIASATCPIVVAAVELDRGGGIAVAVRDGAQRSEGRVVSDASLAAAWIDSWLRDDFDAPLVAPVPSTSTISHAELVAVASPPRSMLERGSISAAFDQAWTDDGSRWSGLSIAGCARLGAFCIGARVRYATQDVLANQTAATRHDASALATASVSGELGRMGITPELGLGLGRLSTQRLDGCTPLPCDPGDPTCPVKSDPPPCKNPDASGALLVGDGLQESSWTPRAVVALRITIPLFDHVWLDGLASVMLAPFGHADAYTPPAGATSTVPPDQVALPGEPLATFQLGVGLRVGVP